MEDSLKVLLFAFALLTILSYLLSLGLKKKPRLSEPPHAPTKIPLPWVSHMLGLLRRRTQYFVDLGWVSCLPHDQPSLTCQPRLQHRKPILTIPLPGINIYLVSSVAMMPSIQRQPRTISFAYFVARFLPRMVGASTRSLENFSANVNPGSDKPSVLREGIRVSKRIFNSHAGTVMNLEAAMIISDRFKVAPETKTETVVDMWEWVSHETMITVSQSMYGRNNPFWDPNIRSAFWQFADDGVNLTFTNFLPRAIASRLVRGFQGRETLAEAMESYLNSEARVKMGSPIVNAHYPLFAGSVDAPDIARFECANTLASFANTVPTAFWTMFHVFSDPELLEKIRGQVRAITTTETLPDGRKTVHRIDTKRLREVTTLFSAVEEITRHRGTGIVFRKVLEDTTVGAGEDMYRLKKGGIVVVASPALYTDKTLWGEDADKFVATRFEGKIPQMAFGGFGKGSTACCGKNFALCQVSSFVAMLAMRFDITPVDGVWFEPGQDGKNAAAQVAGPVRKINVRMTPRDDAARVSWEFVS